MSSEVGREDVYAMRKSRDDEEMCVWVLLDLSHECYYISARFYEMTV